MDTYDLYNLNDDVLFKSNESFYDFVQEVCGKIEADILRIQGIRNARCLIRSSNLLDILKLDCDEVNDLKFNTCFQLKSGDFIIKQGVKLNLDNLFDALKDKHDKYSKKNHRFERQKKHSQSITNAENSNNTNTQNSDMGTTTGSLSTTPSFDTNTTNSSLFISKHITINEHINFIKDLIEKFSRKTFVSTVLQQDEHYELLVTQDNQTYKAVIKCRCGTKLVLPMRSDPNKFILSNFYAHLTTSSCSMVSQIFKEEKQLQNTELEQQSTLNSVSQPGTPAEDNNSGLPKKSKRKHHQKNSFTPKTISSNTKKHKR
jgi:hypothetical protein